MVDRFCDVVWVEVHASAGVLDEGDSKAFHKGIESREFEAVVGREADEMDLGDALTFEKFGEAGGFAVAVVKEAAVAVDLGIAAFADNVIEMTGMELAWELGSFASLNAVGGPEDLLEAVEVDFFPDFFVGMVTSEASVVGGVPVLGRDDEVVCRHQFVDDGDNVISFRDGKVAAREEVVLDVDDEEGFHEWEPLAVSSWRFVCSRAGWS